MKILEKVSVKPYNTFGLSYIADRLILASTVDEAVTALRKYSGERMLFMGGGSNLLFTGDYSGTIIKPCMEAISIEKSEGDYVIVSAGAGVNWDDLVEWTVEHNLYGLENLSFIPGTVGASPVQNIGAYGAEIKDYIEKVETISTADFTRKTFGRDDCGFGYRYSIFKGSEKGKYLVTQVSFRLFSSPVFNLEYSALRDELRSNKITLREVREAVISIRKRKLPDPEVTGNAGSFFKNPVIPAADATILKVKNPAVPLYADAPGFTKVAAGWLIEQCGWKGRKSGNAAVHEKQALVLINCGNATGQEILSLSEEIKVSVQEKFGIKLEREVEVINPI